MANGASRIFDVMKKTNIDTVGLILSLGVKSLEPLTLSVGDKLTITSDFCVFSSLINIDRLSVGDILLATTYNGGQKYYIQDVIQAKNEVIDIDSFIKNKYLPLSGGTITGNLTINGKSTLNNLVNLTNYPVNFGKCREKTIVNSYVRLLSLTMSSAYKKTSIWFVLADTQSTNENVLVNIQIGLGGGEIYVPRFSYINNASSSSIHNRLFAIKTASNKIEIYEKMNGSDSPTVSILSMTRFRQEDIFGKIIVDCSTVVSSLPSGTITYPSAMVSQPISLYDNASGTNGTVTLSETSANYSYIEIISQRDGYYYSSGKIYSPNGKTIILTSTYSTDINFYSFSKAVTVSGTTITVSYAKANNQTNTTTSIANTTLHKIVKVLGYR